MRITQARKQELISLAEEVTRLHSPSEGAIALEDILLENEIEWCFDHYGESFDGMLEVENGEFFIHGNLDRCGTEDSGRARFTLGHELGHFFIEEHRRALLQGVAPHGSMCGLFDHSEYPEELEADFFSANLLMPPSRFRPLVEFHETPLGAIKSAADVFRSSLTAAAIHLSSVAIEKCAIVRWNTDGTMAWKTIGTGFFEAGYRSIPFSIRSHLPDDCATSLVIDGRESEGETSTTLAKLFERVEAGSNRDSILREEAMALGRFGFLSVFSEYH